MTTSGSSESTNETIRHITFMVRMLDRAKNPTECFDTTREQVRQWRVDTSKFTALWFLFVVHVLAKFVKVLHLTLPFDAHITGCGRVT